MNYSEKAIPQSFRLYDAFLSHMVIVGKRNDEDDIISCIIALGLPNNGGHTNYNDGLKNNMFGVKQISVPFQQCQL